MTFPALKESNQKLAEKRKNLAAIFDEAGPEMDFSKVTVVKGNTHEIAQVVRQWNDELTELGKENADLKAIERASQAVKIAGQSDEERAKAGAERGSAKGGDGASLPTTKTFGELFGDSAAYKLKTGPIGPEAKIDIDLKTLMTTGAGFAPEVTRTGRVVPFATRPIQVADLFPQSTTTQAAVQFMVESTFTNAAAEVAEGGTYPEAALALTETTEIVRKISVFLPVTDEQLDDEPQVRGYINNRLPFMVRQRLDSQLLTGTGTAPNLRGLLNVVGIQTQAKGADPTPDAVYKAMVKVMVTGQAQPDSVIFNPLNWQDIRLLRTADGIYIWGNPSDAGPERIWGLQVALAQAETLGTAVVADLGNYTELVVRRGIDVQISNSHGTFFVEGKQAIRADMRAALVVYRPAAICTVTGL